MTFKEIHDYADLVLAQVVKTVPATRACSVVIVHANGELLTVDHASTIKDDGSDDPLHLAALLIDAAMDAFDKLAAPRPERQLARRHVAQLRRLLNVPGPVPVS